MVVEFMLCAEKYSLKNVYTYKQRGREHHDREVEKKQFLFARLPRKFILCVVHTHIP